MCVCVPVLVWPDTLNDITQGADILYEHAPFREVPRSLQMMVLTQGCADDLITSSVCLWIYCSDQVISARP